MKLNKLTRRIDNLKKIKEIVEISKFDALQKINKATKRRKHHFSIVTQAQNILGFIESKYHLETPFITTKKTKKQTVKTLWVYLTISSPVLKISYKKYEKIILEQANLKNDSIFTIGKEAKDFAKANDFKIFESFNSFENHSEDIVSLLNGVAFSNLFNEIKLVTHSLNALKPESQILFPINLPKKSFKNSPLKQLRFFPSVNKVVESLSNSFISNIVNTVFQESYEYFYRNKLLKNEESLTNIDNILQKVQIKINKLKRKKVTNEVISISQILKTESEN